MATKRWRGTATAVKQVSTITITVFDIATAYSVTIGGETVSVVGMTNANTTATNLKNALAASTHPYFTAIVWTVATNVVTGTAVTAGVPFVFVAAAIPTTTGEDNPPFGSVLRNVNASILGQWTPKDSATQRVRSGALL